MQELLTVDIWKRLGALAASAKTRKAAIAYVTELQALTLDRDDELITNASDTSIRAGLTSADALAGAFRKGVKIYSHNNIHAKVVILDSILAVGSANASEHSSSLKEAVLIDGNRGLLRSANQWFGGLRGESTRIDRAFVERIQRIPVERTFHGARAQKISLLQALIEKDVQLADLMFTVYVEPTQRSTASVKQAARKNNITLPPNYDDWTFYTDVYSKAAARATEKLLGSRLLISFSGKLDKKGKELCEINRLDESSDTYISQVSIDGDLLSIFDTRKRAPYRLRGSDGRLLCQLLTAGLQASPHLRSKASKAAAGLINAALLRSLLVAGQQASFSASPEVKARNATVLGKK